MSAEDLARAVGTSKALILAYENGHRKPGPQRIRELASALGTQPIELTRAPLFRFSSIAELRRARGLRAHDVAAGLGLSAKTYRRFEALGIVPARHPALVDQLADFLCVSDTEIEETLRTSASVITRISEMERLLTLLRLAYVEQPQDWGQQWCPPKADDPDLLELAALVGRSPASVARLLKPVCAGLRARFLRVNICMTAANFEIPSTRRKKAEEAATRLTYRYLAEVERLPWLVDGFFRRALPVAGWRTFTALLEARDQWTSAKRLGLPEEDLAVLPPFFVRQRRSPYGEGAEFTVADTCTQHVAVYKSWYAALYPVPKTRQGLERPLPGGHTKVASSTFAPGQRERNQRASSASVGTALRGNGTSSAGS